ncbi:T9SS type A sorting domain-containing protein [Marivirga sp. S37H4]|uniref:T9SS type A sorting domain-containing protein n=1 Tax=Marivirga aurantiaca TaxID=2802615 RepID=A0A934WYH7_9BACT|nr:T9SS type A sorting domain-containing protein [Marivirga aurantiaca]MBK6265170.1 T9SS type A sorting domain-containing protein [Marivirga aurantiaca]
MEKLYIFIFVLFLGIGNAFGQCSDNGTLKNSGAGEIFIFSDLINCPNGDVVIDEAGGEGILRFASDVTLNSLTINFQNGNKPIKIEIPVGVTVTIIDGVTFGGQPNKDKFLIVEGTLDVGGTLDLGEIEFEIDGTGTINAERIVGASDTSCTDGENGGTGTCPTINAESCDGSGLCNDSALPIELKTFTASMSNHNVQLDWITAKEENFSHFELERSTDQKNFEAFGIVQGLGESMSDVSYAFTDSDAPYGIVYYRLKAVDIDDTFEYSPVISIENGFNGQLSVFPNPIESVANIKIRVPEAFKENLSYLALYDLQGSMVQEFIGFDPSKDLEIKQALKSGMYLLKVQHNGLEENIRVVVK